MKVEQAYAESLQQDPLEELREQTVRRARRRSRILAIGVAIIWLAALALGLHALGRALNGGQHLVNQAQGDR
jgi:hypothetical protein